MHMATLTIRNLEDPLKTRLRMRAAARNRSMEEAARQILRAALQEPASPEPDLGTRIRARFAAWGDVQLVDTPREAVRPPPALNEPAAVLAGSGAGVRAPRSRRR
jgi:antitoxin FitA